MNSERKCLGCAAPMPAPFLDLGMTPLANSYISPEHADAPEPRFPLAVAFCPKCSLVQLTDLVPPEKLFSEYLYFSSYSESFLRHASAMTDSLVKLLSLDGGSRVLEVASNDGYLLQFFQKRGIQVLGIEPAHNIAAEAEKRGIPTLERFFGEDAVSEIIGSFGRANLVIGNNVLAHVPAINGFLRAVARCLLPGGTAVFEFPYLAELLSGTEFDTIYHEHVYYYSLAAVDTLALRAELQLWRIERQAVHGGSLRVFLRHRAAAPIDPAVAAMLADEKSSGRASAGAALSFGGRVEALKAQLVAMLQGLRRSGKRLAAYGAPAKGNTLLNFCGIGRDLIEFTVDRSPHKQGKMLPGSRIPILAPEELLRRMPDYALILPWNIADEIVGQQREYLRAGGRFIVPIPHPRIIDHNGAQPYPQA